MRVTMSSFPADTDQPTCPCVRSAGRREFIAGDEDADVSGGRSPSRGLGSALMRIRTIYGQRQALQGRPTDCPDTCPAEGGAVFETWSGTFSGPAPSRAPRPDPDVSGQRGPPGHRAICYAALMSQFRKSSRTESVVALVVRQTITLTVVGAVIGLIGAAVVTRYLEGMLFELTPLDPPTFIFVAVLFIGVALLASYRPAARASSVDPLVALRES